jgi:uncharacterized UBP type Zn finger protein
MALPDELRLGETISVTVSKSGTNEPETLKYHVTALIAHKGLDMRQGHYIAATRKPENTGWFWMNDAEKVKTISDIDKELMASKLETGFQPTLICLEKVQEQTPQQS